MQWPYAETINFSGLLSQSRTPLGFAAKSHVYSESILWTTELAANLFRSTQAEEKLRRDKVQGKANANQVHHEAGVVVRRAIQELGGTMPEDLPTANSIKKLEREEKKRLKSTKPDTNEG